MSVVPPEKWKLLQKLGPQLASVCKHKDFGPSRDAEVLSLTASAHLPAVLVIPTEASVPSKPQTYGHRALSIGVAATGGVGARKVPPSP